MFSKHSDSTLQILGKALGYTFISSNTPDYDANSLHENPYRTLRIGLHDKLINLSTFFTPTWFSDAFIALFGYPFYISTHVCLGGLKSIRLCSLKLPGPSEIGFRLFFCVGSCDEVVQKYVPSNVQCCVLQVVFL